MKSIIKLMVVFVCVVSLVACGRKDTTVSANKDGVLEPSGTAGMAIAINLLRFSVYMPSAMSVMVL